MSKSIMQQRFEFRQKGLATGRTMLGTAVIHTVDINRDWKFSLPLLRLREIESVVVSRHGIIIPDPQDTDDREWCLDYPRAVQCSVTPQDLHDWARRWLPWAMASELDAIIAQEGWRRKMMGPDQLATMIFVSAAERQALGLRTIGACDVTRAQRDAAAAAVKRERDRERQSERRRAEGRVDRNTYLTGSISAQQPWVALGWSRAKYYRLKGSETGVSPINSLITNSDGPVSCGENVGEPTRKVA